MTVITLCSRLMVAAGLCIAGSASAQGRAKSTTPPSPALAPAKALQMRVWINHITKIYHCPGSSYYGNTRDGEYTEEAAARALGYRALGRRACSTSVPAPDRAPLPDTTRASRRMVWLNTESGIYHCPNSAEWGTTRRGKYLTEAAASNAGHSPAIGKACNTR